ncbi:type I pantothenate kinase [Paenibacillus pini]|uniref:Pantothenate kinase n=1 Tax=Paenibacillus pini JCM 16418 TaxID=1236976 RepID=W7YSJ0_9BACL|nr:type I pantothenate kinase [Paenibacillus pini]GAF07596.1 pantothenate kinase [Paenibacillus pini JCM 16418]
MNTYSPYFEFGREDWGSVNDLPHFQITEEEFEQLRGLNEDISIREVSEVYLPLTRLIHLYVNAFQRLHAEMRSLLGSPVAKSPYIIGIAGSVAVGKSTTARLMQTLLSQWDQHSNVALVTTDGFLYPNHILQERGMMDKKGFPESYDIKKLIQFIGNAKCGQPELRAPVYSHTAYDILQGEEQIITEPDILILEGINVLQVNTEAQVFVSDYFDFSIYIDADEANIRKWYVERFQMLRDTAFQNPESYFHRYASLTQAEAIQKAYQIWEQINAVNLQQNILPTKERAKLIVKKGPNHTIEQVCLRK